MSVATITNRYKVVVTTAADGSATAYFPGNIQGRISSIQYVKTDFADGSTITVTGETTGTSIWAQTGVNASATVAPRQPTHSLAGVASIYATTFPVLDYIAISDERIKIVIASGGNTKTGTFYITVI